MEDSKETFEANEREVSEKVDFTGLYAIRDYVSSDKNFIMASMLRGIYYGDSWFSQIPKDTFMMNYKVFIENMLDNGNCAVVIACLPEDPDTIIGYSILSRDFQAIVWVYVKKKWRNKGIGRHLVPANPTAVTHLSALGKELLSKLNGAIFNPFYQT